MYVCVCVCVMCDILILQAALEQVLQLRVFEKSLIKVCVCGISGCVLYWPHPMQVRFWLKSRGEEHLCSRCDIGTTPTAVQGLLEQHDKFEAKAKVHTHTLTLVHSSHPHTHSCSTIVLV